MLVLSSFRLVIEGGKKDADSGNRHTIPSYNLMPLRILEKRYKLYFLCSILEMFRKKNLYNSIFTLFEYTKIFRLWWIYHTLAHTSCLKVKGDHNFVSKMWWWHLFRSAILFLITESLVKYL
jgi:hypothetical protein